MKEHRDFRLRRKVKPLTPERLARILRETTTEKDAVETYERLTGEKIPESQKENRDEDIK